MLATAFFDAGYTTLIWDVSEVLRSGSQNDRQLLTLDGGPGVTFSHDGQRLVTAEQRISVWEVSDLPAQLAPNNLLTLPGHTELVQVLALSPDGRVLASGSRNRKIKLWDLNRGTE
ncbi:MAG: hypothetical protein GTO53_02370, partial [Planctomycetales bacterium]|nr:hypothetical protein [Planctomycetales bacterium]NIN07495.1 hypothetical protein [Planctomycetales bacterium]NIP03673.1 hypothetical protein [Planctomycetales bacterium]